jgi:hypothetical protein
MAKDKAKGRGGERPGAGRKRKHRKTKRAVKVMLDKRVIRTLERVASRGSAGGPRLTKGDLCERLVERWLELGAPSVEKLVCSPI